MKLVKESLNEEFKYFKGKSEEEIEKSLEGLSNINKFKKAIDNNILWLVKKYLKIGIDPTFLNNYAIRKACIETNLELVKILLSDSRVDPSAMENESIRWVGFFDSSFSNKKYQIIKLLLQDKRVRNTLSKEKLKEFEKLVKDNINENVSAPMATLGNTPGMGTAIPAQIAATTGGQQISPLDKGSGDSWGNNLGTYTQKGKLKKKKKRKKIEEDNISPYDKIGVSMARAMKVPMTFKKGKKGIVKQKTFESKVNEELKYFKGKDKEQILKSLEGLTLEEKFNKALINNIPWIIKDCIDAGYNPSYGRNEFSGRILEQYPIRYAALHGNLDMIKILLLDSRVDPTIKSINNRHAFDNAYLKKHKECLKELMKHKKFVNKLAKEDVKEFNRYINSKNI